MLKLILFLHFFSSLLQVNCVPVSIRPVVLWHGLGDSYDSPGMDNSAHLIKDVHPGIFTHSVYLDEGSSSDQQKSFFGNVNDELEYVSQQLKSIPELSHGFDAIGFSQGGLFLRAYAERYNDPPVKKLITYGSPHNGIADLPPCGKTDFLCKKRNDILRSQVWSDYAQSHVVVAQYFRNPDNLEIYLNQSNFLADVNNERKEKNKYYAENLSTLEQLVMVLFSQDETVVPKESAWFQEFNRTSGKVTPLESRDIYIDDWLGLKKLGTKGKIDYLEIDGVHMQIPESQLKDVAKTYLGTIDFPFVLQGDTGLSDIIW